MCEKNVRRSQKLFIEINNYILKFKNYLADRALITDLVTKLVITFGVVLIVGGLYLMIIDPSASTQVRTNKFSNSAICFHVNWIPGIPFYIGALTNVNAIIVGLVSWILGHRLPSCRLRSLGKKSNLLV